MVAASHASLKIIPKAIISNVHILFYSIYKTLTLSLNCLNKTHAGTLWQMNIYRSQKTHSLRRLQFQSVSRVLKIAKDAINFNSE